MRLEVRAAQAEDAAVLVDLYEGAYGGGYSASFDHYGRITPADSGGSSLRRRSCSWSGTTARPDCSS